AERVGHADVLSERIVRLLVSRAGGSGVSNEIGVDWRAKLLPSTSTRRVGDVARIAPEEKVICVLVPSRAGPPKRRPVTIRVVVQRMGWPGRRTLPGLRRAEVFADDLRIREDGGCRVI